VRHKKIKTPGSIPGVKLFMILCMLRFTLKLIWRPHSVFDRGHLWYY